ncbi:hypothetical protein GGQ73_004134 [Rhizobium skierniewicense]|uniref:Uncharacterized protein n=1 Tax=Rhizobium skierniewicense TaxID=984260 RepID=A0A7W6C9H7_9HYPH|nr:hypothetical protein [Rhizobium skierniewicense]
MRALAKTDYFADPSSKTYVLFGGFIEALFPQSFHVQLKDDLGAMSGLENDCQYAGA